MAAAFEWRLCTTVTVSLLIMVEMIHSWGGDINQAPFFLKKTLPSLSPSLIFFLLQMYYFTISPWKNNFHSYYPPSARLILTVMKVPIMMAGCSMWRARREACVYVIAECVRLRVCVFWGFKALGVGTLVSNPSWPTAAPPRLNAPSRALNVPGSGLGRGVTLHQYRKTSWKTRGPGTGPGGL